MNKEKRTELKSKCVENLKNINAIEMLEKAIEMFQFVLDGKEHMEFKIGEDRGIISSECAFEIIPTMIERNKKKIAELNKELNLAEKEITKIVHVLDYVRSILSYKTNSEERKTLINKLIDDLNNRKIKNPSKEVQILQYLNGKKLLRNFLLQTKTFYVNNELILCMGTPWTETKQGFDFWSTENIKYKKWYFSKFKH